MNNEKMTASEFAETTRTQIVVDSNVGNPCAMTLAWLEE